MDDKEVLAEAVENPEVLDPTEVQVPEEVARRLSPDMLVDAGKVVMMVGSEKELRPMTVPQIFQEIFAILGDLDARVQALEAKKSESRLILPD